MRRFPGVSMIRPIVPLAAILLAACGPPDPFIDVRVDRDLGEGDEGSDARHGSLCAAGSSLYATWADDRAGSPQIYFNGSQDGGRTWAEEDTHISLGAPSGTVSDVPSISCEEGRVAIAWEDDRHSDLGDPTIYVRTSADGGATWYPEQRATRDAYGDWRALEPQVLVRETWIYVVWSDNRNGAYDIYSNVSDDVGATWLDDEVRIDTDEPGAAYSANARIAADEDGYVYVVWEDSRAVLNDIYMSRSYSNGLPNSWSPLDIRLDTGDPPGAANSYAPSISAGRGRVAVAWHDRRNGAEPDLRADIYAQVATDRHLLERRAGRRGECVPLHRDPRRRHRGGVARRPTRGVRHPLCAYRGRGSHLVHRGPGGCLVRQQLRHPRLRLRRGGPDGGGVGRPSQLSHR